MLGQPVTMLIPQVIGFKLTGALQAGRDGHRPRAHRHRDAAQERRGRQVRRVLRRRSRQPAARRPRDDRQHGARVRQHLRRSSRSTRRRCATSSSPAAAPSRSRWSRPMPRRRACGATNGQRAGRLHRRARARSRAPSSPASPGPKRPQDRVPLRTAKTVYQAALKKMAEERTQQESGRHRHARRSRSDGKTFELARRRGADRRDHELHEHVESRRAHRPPACWRAMRAQRGLKRKPVGQDQPRARLARRHRLPAQGRAAGRSRSHRLLPRRLRLHDLHRQLRPAAARDLRRPCKRGRHRRRARCSPATATSKAACTRK